MLTMKTEANNVTNQSSFFLISVQYPISRSNESAAVIPYTIATLELFAPIASQPPRRNNSVVRKGAVMYNFFICKPL